MSFAAFSITDVTFADAEEWLGLALKLWPPDAGCVEEKTQVLRESLLETLNSVRETGFLVRTVEGEAIAFINLSLRYEYVPGGVRSPVGYVEGVFVEAAYRQRGVGAMLMAHAEKWAIAQGCTQLASDALIENVASYGFHTAVGFEVVERVVCFIKSLDSTAE